MIEIRKRSVYKEVFCGRLCEAENAFVLSPLSYPLQFLSRLRLFAEVLGEGEAGRG